MKLLIDSHVFLWALMQPGLIGGDRLLIENASNEVFVSAATIWELLVKKAKGKLSCPDNLADYIPAKGFQELQITARHGSMAARLPMHHGDPFDRMLVAQAIAEGLTLLTVDKALSSYGPFVRVV